MKKNIAIILLDGFEEIEAITPIDILRRLDFNIKIAGEKQTVKGAHNISINTDVNLNSLSADSLDCIILPGGMPGSVNLKNNPHVIRIIKQMHEKGKLICAICAAPIVLAEADIVNGVKLTCYPSFKDQLKNAKYTGKKVEEDKNIVTGAGPGAAFDFAFTIAAKLGVSKEVEELKKGMLV